MRTERVQVLLEPSEREKFARAADRSHESLSSWLRDAGRDRLAREQRDGMMSVSELREFFDTCNASDDKPEPDWQDHKRIIEQSIGDGATDT